MKPIAIILAALILSACATPNLSPEQRAMFLQAYMANSPVRAVPYVQPYQIQQQSGLTLHCTTNYVGGTAFTDCQ